MPVVFNFDSTDIAGKNMIHLQINGKKQKFQIKEASLKFKYLLLESTGNNETFQVKYFTEKRTYDIHGFRK